MGRHARVLAKRGYLVTAIDRDQSMLSRARELGGGPRYIQADVRDYRPESCKYDAIIIMGQSFGHFDAATNQAILDRFASGLRHGGRLLLDLWNRDFFNAHQGERDFQLSDGTVRETKRVKGDRLFVQLTYPTGGQEHFEWQLFAPESIEAVATPLGFRLVGCYSDFLDSVMSCSSKPRIQFILERV